MYMHAWVCGYFNGQNLNLYSCTVYLYCFVHDESMLYLYMYVCLGTYIRT